MVVGQVGRDAGWVLFWVPKGITKIKAPQIKRFKEVYRYDAMSFIGDAGGIIGPFLGLSILFGLGLGSLKASLT